MPIRNLDAKIINSITFEAEERVAQNSSRIETFRAKDKGGEGELGVIGAGAPTYPSGFYVAGLVWVFLFAVDVIIRSTEVFLLVAP